MDTGRIDRAICDRLAAKGESIKQKLAAQARQDWMQDRMASRAGQNPNATLTHVHAALESMIGNLRSQLAMLPLMNISMGGEPITEEQLLAAIDSSLGDVIRMNGWQYEVFIHAEAPNDDSVLNAAHQFRNRLAAELPEIIKEASRELGN